MRVPGVLLSGNHEHIRRWRAKQALGRTWQRRPDLLDALKLNSEQQRLLTEYIGETTGRDRVDDSRPGAAIGSKS